jgi:glycosyltransferase involved in cell wall biosynthesis
VDTQKILLVGDYPPPHGGIAVHVRDLHSALHASRARVRVLAPGGRDRAVRGVTTVRHPTILAVHLARYASRGYLVHAHISGHTPKSWLLALACTLFRARDAPAPLLTVHSGLTARFLAVSRHRRALARLICQRFGLVVAVDAHVAAALAEVGAPTERLCIVPAFSARGVDPGDVPTDIADLRQRISPLLCAAVTERPVYGARALFQALPAIAKEHPAVGAVLFGPRSQELRLLAQAYRVEDRVACLGELARARAQAVISACDVFVRPTLADGDAITVREAMQLGRPVAASAVGYRPAGVALFRPGDPEELARAVLQALACGPIPPPPMDGVAQVLELYAAMQRTPTTKEKLVGCVGS